MALHDIELSTLSLRRTPVLDAVGVGSELQLVVLLGNAVGQSLPLGSELVLGRGMPELPIDDDGVSRRHASITARGDGTFVLRDLGSRNGTYVNGVRVQEVEIGVGDRIAMGGNTVLQLALRDRFEEQRRGAQKLQALGELAGGIAHDFNNLLGVVLANVSHLQALPHWNETDARRVLAEVAEAARRAGELTHDLMAFARSGPRVLETLELSRVVDGAVRILSRTQPKSIAVDLAVQRDLRVRGDRARLEQVVANIGVNAIAAMPEGGRLRIAVSRCEAIPPEVADEEFMLPAGDLALLSVVDSGVGMEPEVRRRAFEPFFSTRPRGAGTGLGLATAMAIVRDHGGHIAIHSRPGHGTAVHVFLPLRSGNVQPERRTLDDAAPLSGRVLVADDEALVRLAARRVLEQAGLQVIEAADGRAAVDALAAGDRVDLVLLDLDMPVMDGEQALGLIRQLRPALPVLISTGYVERAREEKLRATGIDGILDKPYDSLTLLRAVATSLRDAERRQQG
ncbi:MAG: response regulator [Nannocystaceae bacterium]|nr:response regulator [Nannocystaceae bacterium]